MIQLLLGGGRKGFLFALRNCPKTISIIRRRMDFQSVRKKTDWKSILRFAKPHIISGQLLRRKYLLSIRRIPPPEAAVCEEWREQRGFYLND